MSEIKVPDLGESISEGTIYKWLVKEGDTVGQGDVLAELETDKVNLEISAEEDGVISSILRQAGDNVAVGEAIGIIDTAAGAGLLAAHLLLPAHRRAAARLRLPSLRQQRLFPPLRLLPPPKLRRPALRPWLRRGRASWHGSGASTSARSLPATLSAGLARPM